MMFWMIDHSEIVAMLMAPTSPAKLVKYFLGLTLHRFTKTNLNNSD